MNVESRKKSNSLQLNIETLEPRMMLSTVSIFASGSTGDENIEVSVAGQTVLVENGVSTQGEVLSFDTNGTVDPNDLRISFTNDLYNPGVVDRNLTIEKVVIDGIEFDPSDSSVLSTGTWRQSDGIVAGYGRGDTLHANGYFQFATTQTSLEWQDATWSANRPFNSSQIRYSEFYDEVTLSGAHGPISISREFDVVGDQLHKFSVDAYRNVISGSFASDSQPWATTGINFYNDNGQYLGQRTLEFNGGWTDPSDGLQEREFVTPEGATTAYAWVWIDGFDQGINIPIIVRDVQFATVDLSGDTTPPTVTADIATITSNTGEINFRVNFADETRLGSQASNAIRVIGPNGFDEIALQRAPGGTYNDTLQQVIVGLVKPNGGNFTQADNGVYNVFLEADTVFDQAGNTAAPKLLGTLIINIV